VVKKDMSTGTEGDDAQFAGPGRLAAFVYTQSKNAAFAKKALTQVTAERRPPLRSVGLKGPDVVAPIEEIPGLSTNTVAQSCLTAIEVLAMCGDQLPA
jgi:hypothetical protein